MPVIPVTPDDALTCADAAAALAKLFKIGDLVRLKSESRWMTITYLDCVEVGVS